jgi:ferricrocin synthase
MSPSNDASHGPQALSVINPSRRVLPGPQLLHDLISVASKESVILDFMGQDDHRIILTYGQFQQLTDCLAMEIRERLRVKNGHRVIIPVIMPQCPELYLAWVAVLKSGAAFCPVSHDVPQERLKFILQDVEASFVLATSHTSSLFSNELSALQHQVVSLPALEARLLSFNNGTPPSPASWTIDSSDPAYVMYTSGSTGLPKGVMVSHFAVSQSLLAHDEHLPSFARFLQFASPTFDVSIFETFFPFFRGATLVGCERERMLADLPATIRTLNADAAELTPTVAGTLLRRRDAAPCLTTLLTIGEMLTTQVVSEFGGDERQAGMLYAMYGPTEAAIHCTLARNLAATASVRSIGVPLSTVTAFILSEARPLELAPVGEPGELCIAGQLADGYLNRPDQNRAAFVDLPGHGPIYRTGDRAICRSDGQLEIVGRMSSGQVKLRGQRVELGEIEEVASKTENVRLAIAVIVDEVLVLFCAASREVDIADIRAHCKSWLPPFMRPSEIMLMDDDVPRLPSGKIDRKALERRYRDQRASLSQNEVFTDPIEKHIAEVMGIELQAKLSRNTSFWSVGLDSLKAIKLASALREKYSFASAATILQAENIAELSSIFKDSMVLHSKEKATPDYQDSDEWQSVRSRLIDDLDNSTSGMRWTKVSPCSIMQLAMLAETSNDSALNFNKIWLRLSHGVIFDDLRKAFHTLALRNEIMRTGFAPTDHPEMPFAQVLWPELIDADLSLLHPLRIQVSDSGTADVCVQIHHALYDGWSWEAIVDDLNALLSGYGVATRVSFDEFRSFEQRECQQNQSADLAHWQQKFHDLKSSPWPNLSSTQPERRRRASHEFSLSVSYQELSEIASSWRCSRQTIAEAAWFVLLSCYLDESDMAVGMVSSGRHHALPGIETIIGPCLATLPLRIDIQAVRTVQDLAAYIQSEHEQSIKHGTVTVRDIQRAADISPGTRLFDTLCVWQQDVEGEDRDRSKVMTVATEDSLAYAIVVEFEPRRGNIGVKLTYDAQRLPQDHAELLSRQLDFAVRQIVGHPQLQLGEFWDDDSPATMSLANTHFREFSDSFDLTSTIFKTAELSPKKPAVEVVRDIDPETGLAIKEVINYSELLEKASLVASVLQHVHDVKPDELVCLIGPRSIQLYISILGVIVAGGAYLCIDPRTPKDRISQILSQAKCQLVLSTGTSSGESLPQSMTWDSIDDILAQPKAPSINTRPRPTGEHLAYAVFTSGSTGVPKGVLLTRRNLLSNLEDLSQIYPCDSESDRLLQSCSPAFDVSVFEIFWAWHKGMTICTASNDILFRDLEHFINSQKITHLSMTPSVAALVHRDKVPEVKLLVTAGEPMNSKVFSDWAGRGLYQGYGPSETTNICNVRLCVSGSDAPNQVGPPLPNTSIFICQRQKPASTSAADGNGIHLSPDFRLVPLGGVGEVWVGGEQVGRGYIDPELSARSFYQHPKHGMLYRSGDIGRLLADGSLVVLGREDDQVKLRGQRIELGEINAALVRCEGIRDAISIVVNEQSIDATRLVSFWVPQQRRGSEESGTITVDIYNRLTDSLPGYMIPDSLLRLDQLPLTRQGKVDRRNLVAVYKNLSKEQREAASRGKLSTEDGRNLSEAEKILAQRISEGLGVPPETITRNSSFYALGLDSISAIRVARRLRVHYPAVEISTLLRYSSVAQLSKVLVSDPIKDTMSTPRSYDAFSSITEVESEIRDRYSTMGLEVEKLLPCTPLQESMATTSMDSTSKVYQNMLHFQIRGDVDRLRQAWQCALDRHQILRTGFAATDSAEHPIVQVVLRDFPLPWSVKASENTQRHSKDGLEVPPWSLTVTQGFENIWELTLQMHHCLYDAEAMSVLLSEVESLYKSPSLPKSTPFDEYLSFMNGANTTEARDFWRNNLEGASICKLSDAIMPESRIPAGESSLAQRHSSLPLTELQKAVRRLSSTTLAVFQAAWSRLLLLVFNHHDICFGNVLSGRNLPIEGISNMVAPCFNTLPVRVQLQRHLSSQDLCHKLQDINVEMLRYQSSSLRRIQQDINLSGRSLFDTLILLQQDNLHLDENIWTLVEESGDMSFPFILEIGTDTDADKIVLRLHSEIATEQMLSQLLESFDSLLMHTARYPQARSSDFTTVKELLPKLAHVTPIAAGDTLLNGHGVNGGSRSTETLSATENLVKDILTKLKPDVAQSISRDITIFRLGFDSITAAQIASRLRQQGFKVSSGDLLEAASIGNIADLCQSRRDFSDEEGLFDLEAYDRTHRQSICEAAAIDRSTVQHVWPCTPTQSGILVQYLRSQQKLYYNHMRFVLQSDVDLARLRRAWAVAMKMHKMLRTGFVEVGDAKAPFAMVIYKTGAMQLPWSDKSAGPGRGIKDLQHLQWHVTTFKDCDSLTFELSILHAIYDARALDIILHDVASLYQGDLPTKTDIGPALSSILSKSGSEISQSFWTQMAAEMQPTRFPDLNIHHHMGKLQLVTHKCSMTYPALEKTCAEAGTTIQASIVAAWASLLAAYTGQECVSFGVILSGRDIDRDENHVVFPCISTVPFGVKATPDKAKLLDISTKRCAGLVKHQHTPLTSIKRWTSIEGELFDTVVVFQK